MKIKSLSSADVRGKVVVVRTDYNVPVKDGRVQENTRITASLPTLKYLLENGAKTIHILSHLGRPKGEPDPQYSLQPVEDELQKVLGESVEFRPDFSAGMGKIQLHENVRFHAGEKKNDPALVKEIYNSLKPDLFVLDGFAVAHRAQASVIGLAEYVPAYAGFLVEEEIKHLSPYLSDKNVEGLTVVVGGAKLETKLGVLEHFAKTADNILVGGALSTTFLAATGYDVGESLYQPEQLELAQDIRKKMDAHHTGFHSPIDVICADDIDAIEMVDIPVEDVCGDMKIFDIGPHSIVSYEEILKHSKVIIWNGPVGCFEKKLFSNGTKRLLEFIANLDNATTVLGGGDTLSAMKKFGISQDSFTHVSTGGGAMLEFLEGKELPGIEIVKA